MLRCLLLCSIRNSNMLNFFYGRNNNFKDFCPLLLDLPNMGKAIKLWLGISVGKEIYHSHFPLLSNTCKLWWPLEIKQKELVAKAL